MDVDAKLLRPGAPDIPVLSLALVAGLNRFPRLYALAESVMPQMGERLHLAIGTSSNDATSTRMLSKSCWYVTQTRYQPEAQRCLIVLSACPAAFLQIRPFAQNAATAPALLARQSPALAMQCVAGAGLASMEAFVSRGETLEQMARRAARLTNEVFCIKLDGQDAWRIHWAKAAKSLAPESMHIFKGVWPLLEYAGWLESELQSVTVPTAFDRALHQVGGHSLVFNASQLVQLGAPADHAVHHASPVTEAGAAIGALRAGWRILTDINDAEALWGAGALQTDASGEPEMALCSIFLYGGNGVSGIAAALASLRDSLGADHLPDVAQRGWSACALTVPLSRMPAQKGLLERLLERERVDDLMDRLVLKMGLGLHDTSPRPAGFNGELPAVVVDNPNAPGRGPVSLTLDHLAYRTKIWVRLLGVDGAIEVDWATPFASHDNSKTGGGAGGDLVLVPTENTLGYVAFLGNDGAPFFHASTHYRDTPVSLHIDPSIHRHGLVTDEGLLVYEQSANVTVRAHASMVARAAQVDQRLGNLRDSNE